MVKRDFKFWLVSGFLLLSGIVIIILGIFVMYLGQDIARSSQHLQSLGVRAPTEIYLQATFFLA